MEEGPTHAVTCGKLAIYGEIPFVATSRVKMYIKVLLTLFRGRFLKEILSLPKLFLSREKIVVVNLKVISVHSFVDGQFLFTDFSGNVTGNKTRTFIRNINSEIYSKL